MPKDNHQADAEPKPLVGIESAIFKDVSVELQARLGAVSLSIGELLALKSGSVLKLDVKLNDPIELRLNQTLVARGEIVAVDDNFGVRLTEVSEIS